MPDPIAQPSAAGRLPSERGPRRFPWLWVLLALGLPLSFLIDGPVLRALHPVLGTPFAHILEHTVRWLGNGKLQIPALAALLLAGLLARSRPMVRAGCWAFVSLTLAAGVLCQILKVLIGRARPWVTGPPPVDWVGRLHGPHAHDFQAFPSGDATATFAIAVMVGYFLPKTRLPLLIAGVLVAMERVILAAHHPSDVWAGAMLGLFVSQALIGMHRRRTAKQG